MFRKSSALVKRLLLAGVLAAGLLTAAAVQKVSASDLSCSNIYINGQFTGNVFCTSSTSSAGFYYFTYNVYTGAYTDIGPVQ